MIRGRYIQQALSELAHRFEENSRALFQITKNFSTFDYENGMYGIVYLKPNKRLAKIFSTDREIIALVTNFPEQQQRTVHALKTQVVEAQGRLEGTLAIVIHVDPDGNSKLKNWGREQGFAILPVSARDSLANPEVLEREILQDFFSNDPFDVTGPVSDDMRFFGRRSEALDIARQLRNGQIRSVLGVRKIGKTSILNRILHEAVTNNDCLCVMIDCSKDEVWGQNAAELLFSIAESIKIAEGENPKYAEITGVRNQKIELTEARTALLSSIQNSERTVIIFFDEIDYITPGSPTARDSWGKNFNLFWRNLRVVTQECSRRQKKMSLFVSGVSSKWFKEESIDGVENAALSFIPEEYLSPLSPSASAAMIRSISKVSGLAFDETTAELIGNSCGNMPYWTRKACSYIHRNIDFRDRPCVVKNETVARLVKEFVDVEGAAIAEVALNHLFRVHPDIYLPAKSVFEGYVHLKTEPLIATLLRYGILAERFEKIHFGSAMVEEGFKLYQQKQSVSFGNADNRGQQMPITNNMTIDEWADELAIIGANRNKLEKKLRALSLNFIKLSSLQGNNKPTTSERIQKCIEKSRLERLKHLPSDDLIEKLLWLELIRLIEIEWPMFNLIFKDLRQFKENAVVVNDRPDTHAKDMDLADIAHHRRSLRWLEDALLRANI